MSDAQPSPPGYMKVLIGDKEALRPIVGYEPDRYGLLYPEPATMDNERVFLTVSGTPRIVRV